MKERPILFSTPMVRAILEGRKTVTRRIVKPQPELTENAGLSWRGNVYGMRTTGEPFIGEFIGRCPYGKPGDRLWVRETWRRSASTLDSSGFEYFASAKWPHRGGQWKPSIHMSRHAARIMLEVIDVRVERLHDITDEDVFAEGIDMNMAGTFYVDDGETLAEFTEPRDAFACLWDNINGERAPWATNPWVWRIEFRTEGKHESRRTA